MQTLRPPVVSIQTGFHVLQTRHDGITYRPAGPKLRTRCSLSLRTWPGQIDRLTPGHATSVDWHPSRGTPDRKPPPHNPGRPETSRACQGSSGARQSAPLGAPSPRAWRLASYAMKVRMTESWGKTVQPLPAPVSGCPAPAPSRRSCFGRWAGCPSGWRSGSPVNSPACARLGRRVDRAQRRRPAQRLRQVHRRPGPIAKRRIEHALRDPGEPGEDTPHEPEGGG